MGLVLVVDDRESMRDSVATTLVRAGMEVQTVDGGQAALDAIAKRRPDCVVTDLKMPGMTGIELLEEIRKIDEDLPVVLMTAFGTVETAVRALKIGAFDYLSKPFEGDELIITIKRAKEHARLKRENALLRAGGTIGSGRSDSPAILGKTCLSGMPGLPTFTGLDRLVGSSPAMRRVREQVLAVAESAGTVLICGESGSGKEVIAHAVHELSPRRTQPFVGLNCAALSESLLESELFGHEKGAFTGADKLRKGRFELAESGTLLLDEISEIPVRLQAKLLRVLQERVFERVGSSMAIGCDVRVIATSNQDLPRSIARGHFRQDLFFRLNVLPIHLPPLRDRPEDIAELAQHFLILAANRDGRPTPKFAPDAEVLLRAYSWPGNVRELQNICERAAVLCRDKVISADAIGPWLAQQSAPVMTQGAVALSPAAIPAAQPNPQASPLPAAIPLAGYGPNQSGHHGHDGHIGHDLPLAQARPLPSASMFIGHADLQDAGANNKAFEVKPVATPISQAPPAGSIAIVDRPLEDIERDTIVYTLNRFNGHRQRTAQVLGIGVRTLGLKLKKWKEQNLVDAAL